MHIDIARGIGILLVVFGHNWIVSEPKAELFNIISSFHVPLFFFLSGLFLHADHSFKTTALTKAKTLLKPYFVTMITVGIFYALFLHYSIPKYIVGMLYGNGTTVVWPQMWFLPHLWVVTLFAWFVLRMTRFMQRSTIWKLAILTIILIIGVINIKLFWLLPIYQHGHIMEIFHKAFFLPGLPFSLDIVLASGFFFLLGFWLRTYTKSLKPTITLFLPAFTLFGLLHYFFNDTLDLSFRLYDNILISTAEALLGIYIVLCISAWLPEKHFISRSLAQIGEASLIVFIFHGTSQGLMFALLQSLFPTQPYINAIAAFIVGVSFSMVMWWLITRVGFLKKLYLDA